MFDCMEALGMGPRQLYDVTARGACMLRKASPFFAGLDPFAWSGTASIQCKWKTSSTIPLEEPVTSSTSLSISPPLRLSQAVKIRPECSLFVFRKLLPLCCLV